MQVRLLVIFLIAVICLSLPVQVSAGTAADSPTEIFVNETVVQAGDALQFNGTGPLNATWHWDFGDGGISESTDPVYTYENPGTYTVTARVSSGDVVSVISRKDLITVVAEPAVIRVPGNFTSIQDAVADAPDGAAVIVDGGAYEGRVTVDRPIAVYGNVIEGKRPVLSAGTEESVLVLTGPGCRVQGFTVDGAAGATAVLVEAVNTTVSDLQVAGGTVGIQVQDASGVAISACRIEDAGTGILAESSPGVIISGNTVNRSTSDGIRISDSAAVFVRSNTIRGAKEAGIALSSASNCTISENVIDACGYAVSSVLGADNTFWLNVISGSTGAPVVRGSADHWNATSPVTAWSGSSLIRGYAGNYWEDHHAPDTDGDGFLDEPYWIDTVNIDYHPLASVPGSEEVTTVPVRTQAPESTDAVPAETQVTPSATITTPDTSAQATAPGTQDGTFFSWMIPVILVIVAAIIVLYLRFRQRRNPDGAGPVADDEIGRQEKTTTPVREDGVSLPVVKPDPMTALHLTAEDEAQRLAASGKGKEAAILLFREVIDLLDGGEETAIAPSATPAEIGRVYRDMPYAALLQKFLKAYTVIRYQGGEPSDEEFEALLAVFHELAAAVAGVQRG